MKHVHSFWARVNFSDRTSKTAEMTFTEQELDTIMDALILAMYYVNTSPDVTADDKTKALKKQTFLKTWNKAHDIKHHAN